MNFLTVLISFTHDLTLISEFVLCIVFVILIFRLVIELIFCSLSFYFFVIALESNIYFLLMDLFYFIAFYCIPSIYCSILSLFCTKEIFFVYE